MLTKLKLLDPDGRVSLTNLSVYVVLFVVVYSVVRSGALDLNALGALLTALSAQRAKLWQQDKRESREFGKLQAQLAEATRGLDIALKSAPRATASALPAGLR
jgi:hypothetical protein